MWAPWESHTAEHEAAWVAAYVAWFDRIDNAIASKNSISVAECERRFRARVGEPPTGRLEPAAEAAARSCAGLRSAAPGAAWLDRFAVVAGRVTSAHELDARPVYEADLSAVAGKIAGQAAHVHCWDEDDWFSYSQQTALLYGIESRPIGLATPASARIDLAQSGCEPLRSFYRSSYAPTLSTQKRQRARRSARLARSRGRAPEETGRLGGGGRMPRDAAGSRACAGPRPRPSLPGRDGRPGVGGRIPHPVRQVSNGCLLQRRTARPQRRLEELALGDCQTPTPWTKPAPVVLADHRLHCRIERLLACGRRLCPCSCWQRS